jgi:hypothetical protein
VPATERPPVVLNDFEGDTYGDWKVTGLAFGKGPAKGAFPNQQPVRGHEGKGLANSQQGNDDLFGTLVSPPFTVNRKFINFLIGGGNYKGETCINLVVDRTVARTAVGENDEQLKWRSWKVDDLDGKDARIEILDRKKGGWGHINIDQLEMADTRRAGPSGPIANQPDFGTMALAFAGPIGDPKTAVETLHGLEAPQNKNCSTTEDPYPFPERRNAALWSSFEDIKPGARRTFTFVLAWHSPNAPNGHEYVNRFPDASAVAHYVLDHHERLTADTRKWRDTYYDSTLPYWLLDRLHSTASYLATGTCQWWKNGRFYAYEGVVCCEGTCTHVWNYAHAYARLFPEMARSVREMQDFNPVTEGGGFHPDTGLVGFRSDNNYAADGQCGTILKAYREHLMSANNEFLTRNWPKIKQALEFSIQRDGNEDGLIECSQHNTYDINFEGPNTFVGSLYLAALRAGEEMAREMGNAEFADRCRKIFESGSRLTLERLWDGEYFIQAVDLRQFPRHQYGPGCLSDQLFGQGWARQLALGNIYPEANVKTALQSIWKYNWAPDVGPYNAAHRPQRWFISPGEAGLITCTWPKSAYLDQGVLYREEVWTGIEYQVAGHMIWEGMLEEGLAICRAAHDRYHPLKRNPYNEVECGDHYARAMASWGVFLALAGYEYHGPKGHLGFAPRITPDHFKAAFTAAEGWGTFTQKRQANMQQERIEVAWGKLRLKTLAFALPANVRAAKLVAKVNGQPVATSHTLENGRLTITLADALTLDPGIALEVTIS